MPRKTDNSVNHHWWPVGLQKDWRDKSQYVYWIEPSGKIDKLRSSPKHRDIGVLEHGHTILRGSVWESKFELDFNIDDSVDLIISALRSLEPLGRRPREFVFLLKLLFRKDRTLREMCKFHQIDEKTHRRLLLLTLSLLIRSPANRFRYEMRDVLKMPPDPEIGKMNMAQNFSIAKKLCLKGPISDHFFVVMHSPLKTFVFGDGSLDWLTSGLLGNRIDGKALMPLTPNICVYFCTRRSTRPSANCASLYVAPEMVDWVNEITQIYSKDRIFFKGKAPKLTEAFRRGQFLEHKEKTDELIDMLDEIAGIKKSRQALAVGLSGIVN